MINKARLYYSLVVGALLCGGSFAVMFTAIAWPMGIFDIILMIFMSLVLFYIWGNFIYAVFLYMQKKRNRQEDVKYSAHGILVLENKSLKQCLVMGILFGGTFLAIAFIMIFRSRMHHPLQTIILIAACYGFGLGLGYSRYLYRRVAKKYYDILL